MLRFPFTEWLFFWPSYISSFLLIRVCTYVRLLHIHIYIYIYIYIYMPFDFREPNPRHPILPKNILGDYYKQVQLYK